MSNPATLNATVSLIRKSRLVSEDRLRDFLRTAKNQNLALLTPGNLLEQMVTAGLLTAFQAEQLHRGRTQGFLLGKYRILDMIGRGGMGQIYLAEHTGLGKQVAIKVLSPKAVSTPLAHERFLREATSAAHLSHPNIVRIFDVNFDSEPPFLVMEYIKGASLQAIVARTGTLSAPDVAHFGRQIALGLQHLSERGLVHRDIKPANILIDHQGTAKILDLGIVQIVDEPLTSLFDPDLVLGTIDYISPEQATNSQVDARADIYSLGATLYFLLAGHPPFPGGDARSKVVRIFSQSPLSISKLRPDVPDELAETIHRMLAKNPGHRFTQPADVAEQLASWANETNTPQRNFGQYHGTISEEGSQTTNLHPAEHSRTAAALVLDDLSSQAGTVEFSKDPTETPERLAELTLRTQIDAATAEAALLDASAPAELTPEIRQDRLLRIVGWGIVGLVVATVGIGTLVRLLSTP